MKKQYDDIIHLPHHVSKIRPQMSMQDRAAQFSPFAALTGYDAAIKETGRLTVGKVEMDEEALSTLNTKFHILVDSMNDKPEVTFTYFKPDKRKAGGAYVEVTGMVKKIDDFERLIVMQDWGDWRTLRRSSATPSTAPAASPPPSPTGTP